MEILEKIELISANQDFYITSLASTILVIIGAILAGVGICLLVSLKKHYKTGLYVGITGGVMILCGLIILIISFF